MVCCHIYMYMYIYIYVYMRAQVQSPSAHISHILAKKLEPCCSKREVGKSIFPIMATFQFAEGSYFLQMPTQEGRQALVIFPPGEQSIKDIKHMYELQDEDDIPQLQSLKRVMLTSNGGFKCLLQSQY